MKKELEFAVNLVEECSALARRIQSGLVTPAISKSDRSPVTVADYALQALAGKRLDDQFPGAVLVAEENSETIRKSENAKTSRVIVDFLKESVPDTTASRMFDWIDIGSAVPGSRYWVLDPIDGTKGFLRNAYYAVALSLVENGTPVLGVLGCPSLNLKKSPQGWDYQFSNRGPGIVLYAGKGSGTWLKSEAEDYRLQVSNRKAVKEARILRSFESGHTDTSMMSRIAGLLGLVQDPVRMDSQAKYALLASGCGDLLFRLLSPKSPDYREKIWDQAAGVLIVEEAGGQVTDLDGKILDFTAGRRLERNRGVIASNGLLHHRALDAVRHLGA